MAEQRANQMAMLVELRRLADDRHDAVGPGQLEEAVDLAVAEARDQIAQRALLHELFAELVAPGAFVRREPFRVEAIACERRRAARRMPVSR